MKNLFTGKISVVIPCLNEAGNISSLCNEVKGYCKEISDDYEIIIVDDGSDDGTFDEIIKLNSNDPNIHGLSLSRNFGHQLAILAGMDKSKGDVIIMMDGDHQHPPSLIPVLIEKHLDGYDVVNTRRNDPDARKISFKYFSSKLYYYLINKLSDVQIEKDGADFRLMSRKVADAFLDFKERDRFMRGLVKWMGYNQITIDYNVQSRKSGVTKYSLNRMLKLALDGITSMSSKPLRISFIFGITIFFAGLIYGVFVLISFFLGNSIEGWTSILITVLLIGGVQLLILSIIGEYLGRIFNENKKRPLYLVKDEV